MEQDHSDQEIGAPVVDVPYQATKEKLILEADDRGVRPLRTRFVGQHQQHTGEDHEPDQGQRAATETEGVGVGERAATNTHRPHVEDKVFEDLPPLFALRSGHDRPLKDRSPDLRKETRAASVLLMSGRFRVGHPAEYSKRRNCLSVGLHMTRCYNLSTDTEHSRGGGMGER